jgi:O-antigen/teichoic acid export membrane protein
MEDERQTALSGEAGADVGTVAKGGAVQIVGQITQRSLLFLFNAIAFRILGRDLYGLYRVVSQVLSIAGQIGLAGFNYAAMHFIARARASQRHGEVKGALRVAVVSSLIASAIVVVGLVIAAGWISSIFSDPRRDDSDFIVVLRAGIPYVPLFALMQVLRYCTQAYKTMVPSVIAGNIVQPAARFILGVAVLAAGAEVLGLIVTLWVSIALGTGAAVWSLRRMLTDAERSAERRANAGAMVRFALPQGGSSLLGTQALGLGLLVLGAIKGDAAAGLFGIALSLQGPGTVFLSGIVNIWAPVVAELHEKRQIERLESLYQTITRWVATFSLPVFAALMIQPDLFAELFGGKNAVDAASAVAILAVGNIFYTCTGPTGYVLSMTGRPGINFINSLVGVGLYIGLGVLVVPDHGLVGMAIVDSVVTAIVNSARLIEAKLLVGVQPFGRSFLKPVVATAAGAAVLLAWRLIAPDQIVVQITGVLVAGAVYLAVLSALGIDAEERYVWDRIKERARRASSMGRR